MMASTDALLIVGHGTRDEAGRAEFQEVVAMAAGRRPERTVGAAFLELAEPDIAQGIAALVERNVRRIDVVPLLLFAAGHARQDIPAQLDAARTSYPHVEIVQHEVLGCHPQLLELSALRYRQSLAGLREVPASETALVVVGRGSHDAEASAEMHRFVSLRHKLTPVGQLATCFIAMAKPSVAETLDSLAAGTCRRIVVQPHLLFHGQLFDDLEGEVQRRRMQSPDKEWVLTPALGDHPLLAEALVDRFSAGKCSANEKPVTESTLTLHHRWPADSIAG